MQTWLAIATIVVVALHLHRGPILGTIFCLPFVVAEGVLGVGATMFNTDASTIQWTLVAVWTALLALRRMLGGRR